MDLISSDSEFASGGITVDGISELEAEPAVSVAAMPRAMHDESKVASIDEANSELSRLLPPIAPEVAALRQADLLTEGRVFEEDDWSDVENFPSVWEQPADRENEVEDDAVDVSRLEPEELEAQPQDNALQAWIQTDGPNPYKEPVPVSEFEIALMVFCHLTKCSKNHYKILREALLLVQSLQDVKNLPLSLDTLDGRVRRNLPTQVTRGYEVAVNAQKLPPNSLNPRRAHRFELKAYATLLLNDKNLRRKMHFGMGVLQPSERTELYHGRMWNSSVRTSSGQFPILNGEPLFPSDCVLVREGPNGEMARYRVTEIGVIEDAEHDNAKIGIVGHRLHHPSEIDLGSGVSFDEVAAKCDLEASQQAHPYPINTSLLPPLILCEDHGVKIELSKVVKKIWVRFLDYPSLTRLENSLLPSPPSHAVRHLLYHDVSTGAPLLKPVHKRHRLLAERELVGLGRKSVEDRFVQRTGGRKIVSLPFGIFLDDFGLYRNTYRSLPGLYFQPWNLCQSERFLMRNMFVLMIAPFGCSTMEIARCLEDETISLERGIDFELDGEIVRLIMFPLAFTGDMPQQNSNCGCMSHKSNIGCRVCYIPAEKRGDLDYDVECNGRYEAYQDYLFNTIRTKTKEDTQKRTKALAAFGLSKDGHVFKSCFNFLDPFSQYPNDPMHCELRLAKYFHALLVRQFLSKPGIQAYLEAWSAVELPYGW